ncbi:hypothetical protein B0H19DRAFT_1227110, partial [Mycena capillaripes]
MKEQEDKRGLVSFCATRLSTFAHQSSTSSPLIRMLFPRGRGRGILGPTSTPTSKNPYLSEVYLYPTSKTSEVDPLNLNLYPWSLDHFDSKQLPHFLIGINCNTQGFWGVRYKIFKAPDSGLQQGPRQILQQLPRRPLRRRMQALCTASSHQDTVIQELDAQDLFSIGCKNLD